MALNKTAIQTAIEETQADLEVLRASLTTLRTLIEVDEDFNGTLKSLVIGIRASTAMDQLSRDLEGCTVAAALLP